MQCWGVTTTRVSAGVGFVSAFWCSHENAIHLRETGMEDVKTNPRVCAGVGFVPAESMRCGDGLE